MKKILYIIWKKVKSKHILFSFLSAIFLIIINYLVNNLPVLTGENLDELYVMQFISEKLGFDKNETIRYDSIAFINVANDKQLIYERNKDGEVVKTTAITDRQKLLHLLSLLEKSASYKYLILDMEFCKGDTTEYDNELFDLISRMDKIVLVDGDSIVPCLKSKSAIAEYYSTVTATNFTRYEYLKGDKRSLPLKVYEELNPEKKIQRFGYGWLNYYLTAGSLCQNSVFLTFDSQFKAESIDNKVFIDSLKQKNRFYNMGSDILMRINNNKVNLNEDATIKILRTRHKDKYVVIGALSNTEDVHDTYVGKKPGCLILVRALQFLEQGRHLVNPIHTICWLIMYFLVALFVFNKSSVLMYLPLVKKSRYKIVHYFANFVSFTIFLLILEFAEYIIFYTVHSQIFPIFYFNISKLIIDFKQYKI